MTVRPARASDLPEVMKIVSRAREEYFEKNGIPQWQGGYPSRELFEEDLEKERLFVLVQGENIIGMVVVCFEHEKCYDVIEDGAWADDKDEYAVVHRIAVSPDFHGMGLGGALVKLADKLCEQRGVRYARSDTHEMNLAMRHTLEKCGYVRRGIIHIEDGSPRVAYEKEMKI